MRQKIQPEQLGCGKPYFCSYSTVVRTATPEGARFLSQYIRRYRAACLSLYQLVRRLFQNPENHLALYGLFLPSRVPDAVQKTWFWAENVTGHPLDVKGPFDSPGRKWSDPGRPDANPKAWADLNTDSTYALLVVLADPNLAEPSTWPARVWHQMINEYNLTCSGLRPGSLEKIFRSIPKIGARRQIGESVGTVVRSFLSSVDLSRARARERESVLSSLETAYPFFFRELRNYVEDVCYWQAACRYLEEERRLTREELRSKGFEENSIRSVLSSTQRAAMRSVAGRMPSLAQIRQATAEEQQMAAQHAELVERFTAALTREGKEEPIAEDVFRRFASQNASPIRLANQTDHLARIITLYHKHVSPSSEALKVLLDQRRRYGRLVIHSGWESVCRTLAKRGHSEAVAAGAEAQKLHSFITRDVRAWFQSLRPIAEPEWPEEPDFWPRLMEGLDWERATGGEQAPSGNAMKVTFRLPGPTRKLLIAASLRGHLPTAKARDIEPLDVANGLCRFLPNQELRHGVHQESQRTYVKLQALCLMIKRNRILANISAMQITQLLRAATITRLAPENILRGDRLGVLHLYPGGRRFGHLVLFERHGNFPGWKQLPIKQILPDTRPESYQDQEGKRVHIRTQRKLASGFVVLDETAYFLQRSRLEKFCRTQAGSLDARAASESAGPRKNLTDTHYRQLAARTASLCRYNRIGYLLIAGMGRLAATIRSEDGGKPLFLVAPTQRFLARRRYGHQRQLEGLLINALRRAGVTPVFSTARARNLWVKPYLRNGTVAGCSLSLPYHEDATVTNGRAFAGKRTLIAPDDQTPGYPFPLNACWAILLDWSCPDFSRHVEQTLSAAAGQHTGSPG